MAKSGGQSAGQTDSVAKKHLPVGSVKDKRQVVLYVHFSTAPKMNPTTKAAQKFNQFLSVENSHCCC